MRYKGLSKGLLTFLIIVFNITISTMQTFFPSLFAVAVKVGHRSLQANRFLSMKISSGTVSTANPIAFSVAPMMAHTNRHFRTFWRLISKRTELYTEMIVADKIVQADEENDLNSLDYLLKYDTLVENPLTLQLGGNNPETLEKASRIAYSYGYRSINLNW